MSTKMEDIIKANGHDSSGELVSKEEMQETYKRTAGKINIATVKTNQLPAPHPVALLLYTVGVVIGLALIAVIGMHIVDFIFFTIGVK